MLAAVVLLLLFAAPWRAADAQTTEETPVADTAPPSVSLECAAAFPREFWINSRGHNLSFHARFSEDVTWSDPDDASVTQGGVDVLEPNSPDRVGVGRSLYVFQAAVRDDVSGAIVAQIPASVATDDAGNPNTASNTLNLSHNRTFSVADVTATEGTSATMDFEVVLDVADDCATATVDYATADGTATAGSDYTAASGTLTFAPGETRKTISIALLDDAVSEGVETFFLNLSNPSDVYVHNPSDGILVRNALWRPLGQAKGDIISDEDTESPTVTLSSDATARVGGWFDVLVTFSEPVLGFEMADLAITNGSAVRIRSRNSSNYWVTIVPDADVSGEISVSVPAAVASDHADNSNTASSLFTIAVEALAENDLPELTASVSCPADGDWRHSSGSVEFDIGFSSAALLDLSGVSVTQNGVNVVYFSGAVPNGSTEWRYNGTVHMGVSGTIEVTALPGAATRTVSTVLPGEEEPLVSSTVVYSKASNTLHLAHDWRVSVSDATTRRGTDSNIEFEVSLNGRDDCRRVTVDWATEDGTAVAGTDYTSSSGTLTFEPGETAKTVSVPLLSSSTSTGDKTLTLRLSNVTGHLAGLGTAEATGTIKDQTAPTGKDTTVTVDEDASRTIATEDFGVDDSDALASVKITALPVAGTGSLTVDGTAIASADLPKTVTSTELGEDKLKYTPPANANGEAYASFGFKVNDGTADSASAYTVTIDVSAVNDAATGAPTISGTALEGETLTADVSGIADAADGLTKAANGDEGYAFAYEWLRVDGETETAIADATASTYVLTAADAGKKIKARVTFTDDDGHAETLTSAIFPSSGTVVAGLTASFHYVPASHDGLNWFTIELHFSEEIDGLSYVSVRDAFFDVSGGSVVKAQRMTRGKNQKWLVRVRPTSTANFVLTTRATESCDAAHAVCTADGRKYPGGDSVTVSHYALSVADARVREASGATLGFVVTLSQARSAATTVDYATSDGTATAGADYTAASGTLTFAAGETGKTVSVAVIDDTDREDSETVTLTLSNAAGAHLADAAATGTVTDDESPPPGVRTFDADLLSRSYQHAGAGQTAWFHLVFAFGENLPGLSFRNVAARALSISGGTVQRVWRFEKGSNQIWNVRVAAQGDADIVIKVKTTTDCETGVCASDGGMLDSDATLTIPGPSQFSVADASVEEAAGAQLVFTVTLSPAIEWATSTVSYATSDGTTTAGSDYTAASGTLTFAAGETTKTVSVAVLDDAHDEGDETLTLTLSSPGPAGYTRIGDGTATGTITNTDPMPKAWIARFGRTVGSQVLDALVGRFDDSPSPHVTVGGMRVAELAAGGMDRPTARLADRLAGETAWTTALTDQEAVGLTTGRDVLLGSSFHVSAGEGDGPDATWTAWGRVATGGFEADVDGVRMDGDVTTGLLGFDAQWQRVLAGVLVSRSHGDGSYALSQALGEDHGTLKSTLTGFYPYARFALGERLSAWGLAGIGEGGLTLRQAGQASLATALSMTMGAVGVRGYLLNGASASGMGLSVRSDAMWVRTESDRTVGLMKAAAEVSRLRLVFEGEWVLAVGAGATLVPTGQVGLRVDAGDAETGAGLEMGAGMRYTVGALSIEGQVRGLVAHEADGFSEWGVSGAIRLSPDRSGRGLSLALSPVWGDASLGAERLWQARDASALSLDGLAEAGGRLEAEVGYGVHVGRLPGVLTPYARLSLGDAGGRAWHTGARWEIVPGAALSMEATRAEASLDDSVEHGVMLLGSYGW